MDWETPIAHSVLMIILIFFYFGCISVDNLQIGNHIILLKDIILYIKNTYYYNSLGVKFQALNNSINLGYP